MRGIDGLLQAIHIVFASLSTDRAIAYRVHQGFAHDQVALSAGIQRMVRSDLAASGVLFTLDTETGFRDVVFITSAYGLGETVVQGRSIRTSSTSSSPLCGPANGHRAQAAWRQGDQDGLRNRRQRRVKTIDVDLATSSASRSPTTRSKPGALCADDRGPLRPADGHRVGQRR